MRYKRCWSSDKKGRDVFNWDISHSIMPLFSNVTRLLIIDQELQLISCPVTTKRANGHNSEQCPVGLRDCGFEIDTGNFGYHQTPMYASTAEHKPSSKISISFYHVLHSSNLR